jgi:hypothetical protein
MEAAQERERYHQLRTQLETERRKQELALEQQEKDARLSMHASRIVGSPACPVLMLALLQIDPENPPEDFPLLPDPDERPPGGQP